MNLTSYFRRLIVALFASFIRSKASKVLVYHDIHSNNCYSSMSTSIDLFKQHINIIKKHGFEIVSSITKDEGQVEITFDDGYLGLYENIDFIIENKIPIKLFIITSFLDKEGYINKDQLLELSKISFVTIGSHTHSHRRLYTLSEREIKKELLLSKQKLDNLLGGNIDSLCYPEGKFDKSVINIARELYYEKQYSLIPGRYANKISSSVIRRSLVQHAQIKEFTSILFGGDSILEFWYLSKHFKR